MVDVSSSKAARLRRRQEARERRAKRRAKRARRAPAATAVSVVVPLRPGPAPDPFAVSKPRTWAAVAGVSVASAFVALPAAQAITYHFEQPRYAATRAGAVSSLDPWDSAHRDLAEVWMYQDGPHAGTARTITMTGPVVDSWSADAARFQYGLWGPHPYGD